MMQSPESTTTVVDGFIVSTETGEVLGMEERGQQWLPENTRDVDWILGLLADADANILAIDARKQALLTNLEAQQADYERRRKYLLWRFENAIKKVATDELVGASTRTLKLDHGQVSFRKTPGKFQILDMEAAVNWAEANKPEAVVVKRSVLSSTISADAPEVAEWLERTPPGENCAIKTGVGE